MVSRPSLGIPLVALVTSVLAVVLLLLVSALFVVVDRILETQVRSALVDETHQWAQALGESTAKVLWNFDDKAVQILGEDAANNPLVLALTIRNDRNEVVYDLAKPGPLLTTVRIPVQYDGTLAGSVELSSSASLVRPRVEALEIPASLAGGCFLVLVVLVTPFVLARTVLRPILNLGRLVETVDPVALPQVIWVTGSRIREVRALENALSTLTVAVRKNVLDLESRVEERTSALRQARTQLAHAEVLTTLGQLTAGIAHELNTPLAAILSAARSLRSDVHDAELRMLAATWTLDLVEHPLAFLTDVSNRARILDTRRDPTIRRNLRTLWRERERDTDSDLFDLLATEALLPIGKAVGCWPSPIPEETALKVVILSARLLGVIDVAAEKGAAVVQALRGQLKQPGAEEAQWFLIDESLERCLVLHRARLGAGIEVRRHVVPGFGCLAPRSVSDRFGST